MNPTAQERVENARRRHKQSAGGVAENGFVWHSPTPEELAMCGLTGGIYTNPATLEQFQVSPLPPDDELSPTPIKKLVADFPSMREIVIEKLLRKTETMNVISASKIGKTHLMMNLAIAVATGRTWLNSFSVSRGRVLYIDLELHPNTFAKRIAAIAQAMGVVMGELEGQLDVLSLRGKQMDIHSLAPIIHNIKKDHYALIVLDAWYRIIPPGMDENANADMTALYNRIDEYAEETGAAFTIVHHSSKGSQGEKAVTDVGSGAGAQSRAADTHLVFRLHEVDGVIVLEGVSRSFPPLESICLRQEYPLWVPAPDLDPTQLKTNRKRRAEKIEPPQEEPWTPQRFADAFITNDAVDKQTIVAKASMAGISNRKSEGFIRILLAEGSLHRWSFPKTNTVYLANVEQQITDTEAKK